MCSLCSPHRIPLWGGCGVASCSASFLWKFLRIHECVAVQSLNHDWFFSTPWTVARQVSQCFTISQSLLKLMAMESVMPLKHLILCHPLLLLPSIFPSIRVFFPTSWLFTFRWPKYWSFTFSLSPSNEYSGLISFRIDWFDLFEGQGTLKNFP